MEGLDRLIFIKELVGNFLLREEDTFATVGIILSTLFAAVFARAVTLLPALFIALVASASALLPALFNVLFTTVFPFFAAFFF